MCTDDKCIKISKLVVTLLKNWNFIAVDYFKILLLINWLKSIELKSIVRYESANIIEKRNSYFDGQIDLLLKILILCPTVW